MTVLGLDVSTSCVGVCVLSDSWKFLESSSELSPSNLVVLDKIDLKHKDLKSDTLWKKADFFKQSLIDMLVDVRLDQIFIEDAVMRFTPGMSSSATITTLIKFNAITSCIVRDLYKIDPIHVLPSTARKTCGLKVQQKAKCRKSQKEQVFDLLAASDLKTIDWPKKVRSKKIVDWAYDCTDAYVVAKAGLLISCNSGSKSE